MPKVNVKKAIEALSKSAFANNPEVLKRIHELVPRGLPFDKAAAAVKNLSPSQREEYFRLLDTIGSREKRAEKLGFKGKNWYHGTAEDFDKFSSDKLRSTFESSGSSGYGHYFTSDPEVANRYAQFAGGKKSKSAVKAKAKNIREASSGLYDDLRTVDEGRTLTPEYQELLSKEPVDPRNKGNILDLFDAENSPEYTKYITDKDAWEKSLRATKKYKDTGDVVYPVLLKPGRPIVANTIPNWNEKKYSKLFKQFRDKKSDSMLIRNVSDALDTTKKSDIAIIPRGSEDRIRSVNAAFDPDYADSPYLLASKAGAALGLGALATQNNEAEASPMNVGKGNKAVRRILQTIAEKDRQAVVEIANKIDAAKSGPKMAPEEIQKLIDQEKALQAKYDMPEKWANPMTAEERAADYKKFLEESAAMRTKEEAAAGKYRGGPSDTDPGFAPKEEPGIVMRTLDKLSIPQRILMNKTAKAFGVDVPENPDASNSEQADAASEALTEQAATNLGIPEGSAAGVVARGTMKTLLDVGYDPLNAVGGVVARGVGGAVKKAPGVLGEGAKIARESIEALVRKNRLNEAMKLFSQKPSTNTARELAAKGAKQIIGAKIFKGQP